MATTSAEKRNAVTILWRIENLSYWEPEYHGRSIGSPNIWSANLDFSQCCIVLSQINNAEDITNLSLNLQPGWSVDFPLDCEFSFLAADGSPLVTETVRNVILQLPERLICMPNCPSHEEVFVTKKTAFLPYDTLTIRCHLWKSESNFQNAEFYFTHSRIQVKTHSFLCPMEDLKQRMEIPVVLPVSYGLVGLFLRFLPRGELLEDYKLFFEVDTSEVRESLLVKFNLCILSNTRGVVKFGEHKHQFRISEKTETWKIPSFVSFKDLLAKNSNSTCDEVLYFFCNCVAVGKKIVKFTDKELFGTSHAVRDIARMVSTFSGASYLTSLKTDAISDNSRIDHSLGALIKDFKLLYQEQTLSDFELHSSDVSFRVHKAVLSARSPVFKAMFSSKMKESESNFLDVPDVDVHSLNRMLTFLYTSCVEPGLHVKSAVDLYYAADKYKVDSLKEECSAILRSVISVSNVSDILTLADKHHDKNLMSFVHDFILSHFDDVMVSDEWEKFLETDPYLAGKTAHRLFKDRKNLGLKTIN